MLLKSFFNTQFIFMQQDTKNKFAAILAAAQAKEAAKQQPTAQPAERHVPLQDNDETVIHLR